MSRKRAEMEPEQVEPDGSTGWVLMTCKNHTDLRWVRKDPVRMRNMISNNMQLMFRGSIEYPDANYAWPKGVKDPYARVHDDFPVIDECECPYSDLYYIGQAD
jgi:hypothetical protein